MGLSSKEILSKLYSLRAGLSVVFGAVNRADRLENESNKIEQKFNDDLKKEKESKSRGYNLWMGKIEDAESKMKMLDVEAKRKRKILFKALGIAALIAVGVLVLTLIIDFAILSNVGNARIPLWIYFFDFAVVFACGIAFNKTLKDFDLSLCFPVFEKRNLQKSKENAELFLRRYENPNSENVKKAFEAKKKAFEKEREATKKQLLLARMEKEYALTVILPKLKNEYSELLYVQNWRHLDLIIRAFETQRADTIYGALSYMDTLSAIGTVIDVLKQSHQEVAKSIKEMNTSVNSLREFTGKEIQRLSQSLKITEQRLNYKVESACNRIIDNQRDLNEKVRQEMREETKKIVSSNNRLINVQEINNALLRESNNNSEEISRKLGIIGDKIGALSSN